MIPKKLKDEYDVLIIGGGFYGVYIAEHLKNQGKSVLVVEKENDFLQRASLWNQARVHSGYHYPRSILTGFRSRISFWTTAPTRRAVREMKNQVTPVCMTTTEIAC